MRENNLIEVKGTKISVTQVNNEKFISLTDMLHAKDGDFFISDWLRNRNNVEFLGIWEQVNNPNFNYGGFATIGNQAGLNHYKISVKEWVSATNAMLLDQGLSQADRLTQLNHIAIQQMKSLLQNPGTKDLINGRN